MVDVAIIGCGIVGAAAAFELSKRVCSVTVLEKENDVATGATRANSAIIHAGYDPEPGTAMARLNVRGAQLAKQWCADLDVPYRQIGSMVLAFSDAATAAALRDGPGHSPEMAAMLACRYRPSLPVTEPLRDDFAPVERFALSLLRRP